MIERVVVVPTIQGVLRGQLASALETCRGLAPFTTLRMGQAQITMEYRFFWADSQRFLKMGDGICPVPLREGDETKIVVRRYKTRVDAQHFVELFDGFRRLSLLLQSLRQKMMSREAVRLGPQHFAEVIDGLGVLALIKEGYS